MSQHFTVFPASTVDALREQLNATAPGSVLLKVTGETGHLMLHVVPADPAHTAQMVTVATLPTFSPLNDSFLCPGSPLCPK